MLKVPDSTSRRRLFKAAAAISFAAAPVAIATTSIPVTEPAHGPMGALGGARALPDR